jgi:hypothetical protein
MQVVLPPLPLKRMGFFRATTAKMAKDAWWEVEASRQQRPARI